ncbi:unnamed protein product [Closterium sp. Yama58-4]|nr:unnamed protein product [Closterium sp. Yama58-4]
MANKVVAAATVATLRLLIAMMLWYGIVGDGAAPRSVAGAERVNDGANDGDEVANVGATDGATDGVNDGAYDGGNQGSNYGADGANDGADGENDGDNAGGDNSGGGAYDAHGDDGEDVAAFGET